MSNGGGSIGDLEIEDLVKDIQDERSRTIAINHIKDGLEEISKGEYPTFEIDVLTDDRNEKAADFLKGRFSEVNQYSTSAIFTKNGAQNSSGNLNSYASMSVSDERSSKSIKTTDCLEPIYTQVALTPREEAIEEISELLSKQFNLNMKEKLGEIFEIEDWNGFEKKLKELIYSVEKKPVIRQHLLTQSNRIINAKKLSWTM